MQHLNFHSDALSGEEVNQLVIVCTCNVQRTRETHILTKNQHRFTISFIQPTVRVRNYITLIMILFPMRLRLCEHLMCKVGLVRYEIDSQKQLK